MYVDVDGVAALIEELGETIPPDVEEGIGAID